MEYLRELISRGGPEPNEYDRLTATFQRLARDGVPGDEVRAVLAPTLTTDSLQGWAFLKPHGYPGDFEMLDRVYTGWRSSDPALTRWDDYFQSQAAPQAVRNRKCYVQQLLAQLESSPAKTPQVLVIGVASARDLSEYFEATPASHLHAHGIDLDPKAIDYAAGLCRDCRERVVLEQRNPRRFRSSEGYDLIWCPGLMDYFDDDLFVDTLQRYLPLLKPGGELAVGNFAVGNPTQAYMELVGDWFLQYRTPEQLRELPQRAGVSALDVRVQHEPAQVNLFLHVQHRGG